MKPLRPWLTLTLSLLSVALIVASQILRATIPSLDAIWWSVFGVASVLAAGVAWYEKQASDQARTRYADEIQELKARQQEELDMQASVTRVALQDALDPLIQRLGAVATSDSSTGRHAEARAVMGQGLHAIAYVVGKNGSRIRANYFAVALSSPRHSALRLVHMQSIGRAGKPRDEFNFDNDHDRPVFEMLLEDGTRFEPNICDELPVGMDPRRRRDYCTYISVPARIGRFVEGLVTVDAPAEGDLSEADIPFVRAVATIMATASVLASKSEDDVTVDESTKP